MRLISRKKRHFALPKAEAHLVISKAKVEAQRMIQDAPTAGTQMLVKAADITTEEQLVAFQYIWSLKDKKDLHIDIDHISDSNIVKTRQV